MSSWVAEADFDDDAVCVTELEDERVVDVVVVGVVDLVMVPVIVRLWDSDAVEDSESDFDFETVDEADLVAESVVE